MSNKKPLAYLPIADNLTANFFRKQGFEVSSDEYDVWSADLIVFVGGEDVTPMYYGERPIPGTVFNLSRDLFEVKTWKMIDYAVPKIGICRGAQFLNVMNNGYMYQDVDKHTMNHNLFDVTDVKEEKPIKVTSTHHQMMVPGEGGQLLSYAKESTYRKYEGGRSVCSELTKDSEVIYYPDTRSLCVQYHPEYTYATPECVTHFWTQVSNTVGPFITSILSKEG